MRSLSVKKLGLFGLFVVCLASFCLAASAQHVPRAERDRISRGAGAGTEGQGAPVRADNWYSVVVTHPEANDFWASAAFNQEYLAINDAMHYCTQAMGDGCEALLTQTNGYIAIARDQYGDIRPYRHNTKRKASRALRDWCRKEDLRCTEIMVMGARQIFDTYDEARMTNARIPPDLANIRVKYSALARDPGQQDHHGFIATGYDSQEQAKAAAMQACRDAYTGPNQCEERGVMSNRFTALYSDQTGESFFEIAFSRDELAPAVVDTCKKHKRRDCRIGQVFDARRQGVFRYQARIPR